MLRGRAAPRALPLAARRLRDRGLQLPAHGQLTSPAPRFDVAIVGAGPAGSSTALHLLQRDPSLAGRVALIDRATHPREKYCAGAVSAWGLDVLARLGLERLARGVAIRALAVRVDGRVGSVEREGLGRVVRRSVFDAALLGEARARGAVAFEGEAVRAIERDGDAWALRGERGAAFRARVVVGADGASGTTRRALGLGERARRARLYLVETEGPEPRDGVARGTLLFDLAPASRDGLEGYYWDFASPLDGPSPGTSRGIFDLNTRPARDASALKRALAARLAERGLAIDRVELKPHSIRPFVPGAPLSVPGALLVGEAAGVDPVTGEGIAHALAMGELAGEAIERALATGERSFGDWSARLASSFVGRHLAQACWLAPRVYGPEAAALCAFLAGSPRAIALAARWYRGERVDRASQLGFAARLGAAIGPRSLARVVRSARV